MAQAYPELSGMAECCLTLLAAVRRLTKRAGGCRVMPELSGDAWRLIAVCKRLTAPVIFSEKSLCSNLQFCQVYDILVKS